MIHFLLSFNRWNVAQCGTHLCGAGGSWEWYAQIHCPLTRLQCATDATLMTCDSILSWIRPARVGLYDSRTQSHCRKMASGSDHFMCTAALGDIKGLCQLSAIEVAPWIFALNTLDQHRSETSRIKFLSMLLFWFLRWICSYLLSERGGWYVKQSGSSCSLKETLGFSCRIDHCVEFLEIQTQ